MSSSDDNTRKFVIGLGYLFLAFALFGIVGMLYENFWNFGSYKKLLPGIILIIVLCFFIPVIPAFIPIKKYVDFNGVADREEFWSFYLASFIYVIIFQIADWYSGITSFLLFGGSKLAFEESFIAVMVFQMFILIPSLSVGARRLHSIGKSGWWQLLILTGIGIILLIIWWTQKSNSNSYKAGSSKSSTTNIDTKLRELNKLYKDGVITKKEFTEAKKKYL